MVIEKIILLICNGNIHRSPIAEYCLKRSLRDNGLEGILTIVSRSIQGAFGAIPPRGKNLKDYHLEWSLSNPVLKELGIDIFSHCSTPVNESIIGEALFILCMDKSTLYDLSKRFP